MTQHDALIGALATILLTALCALGFAAEPMPLHETFRDGKIKVQVTGLGARRVMRSSS
jgi:hypothetical protein